MDADIKVEFVDCMGSDLTVVNAARVSFDKQSYWEPDSPGLLKEQDSRLITYLAEHGHWTPFSHPQVSLRLTVPIAIRNQLDKSRVGLAINEVSRRYVSTSPKIYWPEWRSKPDGSIKQGSGDFIVDGLSDDAEQTYYMGISSALTAYARLLDLGVAPEQARFVLPLGMMTEFIWTGSIAAFARVYNLRSSPDAQYESRLVAEKIATIMKPLFPYSWDALTKKENADDR